MSRSRRRRPKCSSQPSRPNGRGQPEEIPPEWRAMLEQVAAVDEAERAAEPGLAMELVGQMLYDPEGKLFWRPERLRRLDQLVQLGDVLPGWVRSRWLLEQALQDLDSERSASARHCLRLAIDLAGGEDAIWCPPGDDPRVRAHDHDWVFRQQLLYDTSGLRHFLRRRADPGLRQSADGIEQWAGARMGGFALVGRTPTITTWRDLATARTYDTDNIGSAFSLLPGEHVIGRLVPIETGHMFETVPLPVPDPVAQAVADAPARWLATLCEAKRDGEVIDAGEVQFGFVSDVPWRVAAAIVHDRPTRRDLTGVTAVKSLLDAAERALAGECQAPVSADVWACLAAEVLDPVVHLTLSEGTDPRQAEVLGRLAERFAEPAAAVCRRLSGASAWAA